MITLYNVPVSSYGAKVRIILAHKGIEWTELAPPDGYGSPAYRAVIPSGTCLLYTSPSPRDMRRSRMPSSA